MKVTKNYIKQLVKEELQAVLENNTEYIAGDGGADRIDGVKTTLSKVNLGVNHPKMKDVKEKLKSMPNGSFTKNTAMGDDFLYVKSEEGNAYYAANHRGNNRADSAYEELEALGYKEVK